MASECGVIGLNVDFVMILEAVRVKEADHCLRIIVILVLARLARFGFYEQLVGCPDLGLVVDNHLQERCHVVEFQTDVPRTLR